MNVYLVLVMETLTVTTQMGVSIVNAGWDFLEMGSSAQVASYIISFT